MPSLREALPTPGFSTRRTRDRLRFLSHAKKEESDRPVEFWKCDRFF
ncbi:hypothetical protein [Nostoc sp. C110]